MSFDGRWRPSDLYTIPEHLHDQLMGIEKRYGADSAHLQSAEPLLLSGRTLSYELLSAFVYASQPPL